MLNRRKDGRGVWAERDNGLEMSQIPPQVPP